ncbi:hypothetical protein ACFPYI_10195 [Halomarina salina]|uniref:DUF4382 domain-containing protein n=1 Tax=Halomarina salina TaxID=1872699 RepID=A0ABD5RMW5_9EURY|nr:hypothetical protein [Halomarina salina]
MPSTRRRVLAALPCSLALAGCLSGDDAATDGGTSTGQGTSTDGSGLFGPTADLLVYNSTAAPVTVIVRIWPTPGRPTAGRRSTTSKRRTGTVEDARTETAVTLPTGTPPFEETVDLAAGETDDGTPPSGSSVSFEAVAALDERATVAVTVEDGPTGTHLTSGGVGRSDQLSVGVGADGLSFGVVTV